MEASQHHGVGAAITHLCCYPLTASGMTAFFLVDCAGFAHHTGRGWTGVTEEILDVAVPVHLILSALNMGVFCRIPT